MKNEYPELGGEYDVQHHSQFIATLIAEGKLTLKDDHPFKGRRITFHDPCYLGRGNGEYVAPRSVIEALDAELVEMKRCKQRGLCCGAGGAQMFKEAERGNKEVNFERTDDAIETKAKTIATGCPFCNTMMTDGVKNSEKELRTFYITVRLNIEHCSADYKTSLRRNADVKLEVSGAVRRTSAAFADVKKILRVGWGTHDGNPSERRRNMQKSSESVLV